jgi:hypothetical protein
MVSRTSDWRDELGRWLKPFLDRSARLRRRLRSRSKPVVCGSDSTLAVAPFEPAHDEVRTRHLLEVVGANSPRCGAEALCRRKLIGGNDRKRVHAQVSARRRTRRHDLGLGRLDGCEYFVHAIEIDLPLGGQCQPPGRAIDETHTEALLQSRDEAPRLGAFERGRHL